MFFYFFDNNVDEDKKTKRNVKYIKINFCFQSGGF